MDWSWSHGSNRNRRIRYEVAVNQSQKGILWIGVLIVMIFLFTDQSFRNSIFKRGTTTPAPYTTAQILTVPASAGQTMKVPNTNPVTLV